jgi:hypothetical protein
MSIGHSKKGTLGTCYNIERFCRSLSLQYKIKGIINPFENLITQIQLVNSSISLCPFCYIPTGPRTQQKSIETRDLLELCRSHEV